jgi:hypothetical protein
MGPVLELSPDLLASLATRAADAGIRCVELAPRREGSRRFQFRRHVATVVAEDWCEPPGSEFHIYCAHGGNPLMWWPEVRLVKRLRNLLIQWGATEIDLAARAERHNSGGV